MKRLLLSIMALVMFVVNIANAASVKVEMNSTSPTMSLAEKTTGDAVDVGEPSGKIYSFDVAPGVYVLTAYGTKDNTVNGTIELNVTDEAEQEFKVLTNTIYATNKDWVVDNDYTIEVTVNTREGVKQTITIGNSITANRKTFLALNGNSYYAALIPSEAHQAEDYMTLYKQGTLTGGINISGAIPQGADYTITVPADAEFFLGMKFSHFIAFTKVEPKAVENEGGNKKLTYRLANSQTYNYRTWKSGGLTQAGYFTMNLDETKRPVLAFTDADYEAFGAKTIKHDVHWNGGYETGDIFVNINERGHLKLNVGDTFDAHAMRSWELTDNSTNNYFMEPDFHYTVIGLDGTPSTDVIAIEETVGDPWATIKAVGNGTAIVLVTYDAIGLNYYSNTTKNTYMGGEYWSAIWPENTAAYVVTVGGGVTAIEPNMVINESYNEDTKKLAGKYVDAEHDVFYYLDTEEGFAYTFKPTGVENVEIAYPTIGEQMATYTGFGTTGVTKNEDGSYTLLLKEGRQIVRLTDIAGNSVYQVLTAKKCHRDITNVTRNNSTTFIPGDQVKIQYSGLRHPANKMAGIYNMSAYVTYNGIPNGTSLILGSGQYTFGSVPAAQAVTVTIPDDGSEALLLNEGVIQVNGYGDPIGNHRNTSRKAGRSANFTAIAHKTYFGTIPEVRIPIKEAKQFIIRLLCDQEDVNYTLTRNGVAVALNDDGTYTGTYGDYALTASKAGYRCYRHTYTIADDAEGEQTFNVALTAADAATWDGATQTEPAVVEDVYQIGTGAELAWFANQVNGGQYKTKAVLTADIDLGDYAWTPIGGTTTAKAYQGAFDGKGHTVKGLYINNATATYQALFAYLKDATISNVTVEGEVSAKQYVAGIVANMGANSTIDRCVSNAKITGASTYVGGITGYAGVQTAKVTNSYNTGNITGTTNCGGVAGSNNASAVIENVFNVGAVEGTTVGACVGGTTKKDNVKNAFATQEYGIVTSQTTVTDEQMKSGYVARLLGEAFGQTLGTDAHPVIDGPKVFMVKFTTSLSEDSDSIYTNGALPEFEPVNGLYPTWLTQENGEAISEVTSDSTLFVSYAPVVVDAKVADFEDIELAAESHMSVTTAEDDERTEFTSGTYQFHTGCMSDWDYWYWFGYASHSDNTYASLDDQWKNVVGGGYAGSKNYGVAYAAAFSGPCYVDVMHNSTGDVVPGFYITNSAYAYNSLTGGDSFAKKFEKGDWFKLTITGYDVNGEVTGTKDYYLADLRDEAKAYIINDWRYVDLSGLGKVKTIGFEMSSSDTGDWGMNTPAYFCFDNFGAEGEEVLPEKNVEFPLEMADFENLELAAESHMSISTAEDDDRTEFTSGDFQFSTGCLSEWATWWSFGYANSTATKYEALDDQWNNIVGGGYADSKNYGVAYVSSYFGASEVKVLNHTGGVVVPGFYITNSSYAYNSLTGGDSFAKKFGKGDWFKVTITGYDANNEVTGTKDFYLADLRDPNKAYIINDWRYVDLSGLGKVSKLGFELSSTDNGDWGMNTPAYFCFDNFGAEGEEVLPEKNVELPLEVADFENLELAAESHMSVSTAEDDERTEFTSGDFQFSTGCMSEWASWWFFGYANSTSTKYESLDDQWNNIVGGGYDGSKNYGVGYASAYYGPCNITVLNHEGGIVVPGFYITNSAYAYTSMLNGDAYSKKFGKDDWFKLTIKGYDAEGAETGTKEYYLADLRDEAKAYIINDWRYVDLSGLGKVSKLSFALTSTDNGDWGMNTPAYFCFDNFGAEGEEVLPEKNVDITTGISEFSAAKMQKNYYDLKGVNASGLHKGVNIVRMPDGSVRKIVVK